MDDDLPDEDDDLPEATWDELTDEERNAFVDRVVAAFHQGGEAAVAAEDFGRLCDDAMAISMYFGDPAGHLLRSEDIPSAAQELVERLGIDWLDRFVDEARLEELEAGAALTEAEVAFLRETWIRLQAEDPDYDLVSSIWLCPLRHSDGRTVTAVVLRSGYSFSGVGGEFHGLYPDDAAALANLARSGDRVI
jgi:hypothetical protein